ncbi:PREDICTED: ubiquinone biosynthesis protein COQ9-B, mitochondrial [Nicotiana attenuata]|uniref:Ubiquinone biosynthesis protein n=1 Tax=Nicotiana attenuata TaxID=49451 RepID=A0A1J6I601_NICAT|nr:PREDICTED: ubiquinone biosynthesis protein COQ9-B, mitochondrial [Nicotiana attenuata]OIS99937.1 hypothetical protein A4A49_17243 [Nicotiana attenuata]
MYRSAAKRLLPAVYRRLNSRPELAISPIRTLTANNSTRFMTSAATGNITDQNPTLANPIPADSIPADYTASSSFKEEERTHHHEQSSSRTKRPKAHYKDEEARVLSASLPHVLRLGWTETAMISGARDVGVSPSIVGSFPRKEAALVEYFMDECLERLIDIIESAEDLKNLIPSERVAKLVRIRLETQAPYISKWAQALSIQAQPLNVPTSFKQRAMLVDEIWHAVGDDASEIDWYVKRTVLGGIYSTTELYMLTDNSPDFHDTWAFLDARVKDAFDLKKTAQEAQRLAEAVGAGMGGSLQGFMQRVFTR